MALESGPVWHAAQPFAWKSSSPSSWVVGLTTAAADVAVSACRVVAGAAVTVVVVVCQTKADATTATSEPVRASHPVRLMRSGVRRHGTLPAGPSRQRVHNCGTG